MASLIEELGRMEAAAQAEADRLRARIEELSADLARAQEQVTRLAIAREEVARVLEEPAADPEAGQDREPAATARPASPIGAVTVPPRQDAADAPVLPRRPAGISWTWPLMRGARCGRASSRPRRGCRRIRPG
jgi:hypothetical protein